MSETQQPQPTLEDLAAAREAVDGKIPGTVVAAFVQPAKTCLGQKLLPITAGHELLLAHIEHPLATGGKWQDSDVLMALFIFSRRSRQSFEALADGSFESEFFDFVDSLPASDVPSLGQDMVSHWLKSRQTALAMESEQKTAQKKTADSDGGSTRSPLLARLTDGLLTWLSTRCRSAKSLR